jgi:glycosyltransferase involved in cell wall biosynthesis
MKNAVRQRARLLRAVVAGAPGRVSRRRPPLRVGWVSADTLSGGATSFADNQPPVSMRINNTAYWLTANAPWTRHEMYRPTRRYDVVVFFKAMDERCQEEAERIRAGGGRVVFDANVNYYEIWGDYEIEGTKPTQQQQRDAKRMTELADWVVADSEYLLGQVAQLNANASWIPDNVDVRVFRGPVRRRADGTTRLIWSGVSKKAAPLLSVADALASVPSLELVLVCDAEPPVLRELSQALPTSWLRFSEPGYAAALRTSDVIISPKRLVNAYEVAHTEYKISLGMAVGLPAIASPQRSYVTAIEARGGGIVADTVDEWRAALERLSADPQLRAELGARAAATVHERYSTSVTSRAYLDVLSTVGG